MDLNEIVNRAVTKPFSTQEISFCIENFINDKKGTNIKVNVENSINHLPQQFHILYMQQNLHTILGMFDVARKHFNETKKY